MKITNAVRHRRNNNFQKAKYLKSHHPRGLLLLGQAHATAAPKAVAEGRLRLETVDLLPTCNVLAGVDRSRTDQGEYDGSTLQSRMEFVFLYFLRFFFFVFQHAAWGSFPCYLLHIGAKICVFACILELESPICVPTWLLAFGFGFTWLHLASLGLWLMAFVFWLLVLVSLGFGFGRSLHLTLRVCWVLVLSFAYNISCNTLNGIIYIYIM